MKRLEKSTLPRSSPKGGIRMSLTSEVTILPKAAPMTRPTARSTTLPRIAKSRNSLSMVPYLPLTATAWLENTVELGEERSITRQGGGWHLVERVHYGA